MFGPLRASDEDCNGLADDADPDATGGSVVHTDGDGDGHGAGTARTACDPGTTEVALGDDCDDSDPGVSPSGVGVCDAADTDEDCNGLADDNDLDTLGGTSWYVDADGDAYGAGVSSISCDGGAGEVAADGDCDDDRGDVNPAAEEMCDADDTDEDCDGVAVRAVGSPATTQLPKRMRPCRGHLRAPQRRRG